MKNICFFTLTALIVLTLSGCQTHKKHSDMPYTEKKEKNVTESSVQTTSEQAIAPEDESRSDKIISEEETKFSSASEEAESSQWYNHRESYYQSEIKRYDDSAAFYSTKVRNEVLKKTKDGTSYHIIGFRLYIEGGDTLDLDVLYNIISEEKNLVYINITSDIQKVTPLKKYKRDVDLFKRYDYHDEFPILELATTLAPHELCTLFSYADFVEEIRVRTQNKAIIFDDIRDCEEWYEFYLFYYPDMKSENGLYIKDGIFFTAEQNLTNITIPDGVTEIAPNACSQIRTKELKSYKNHIESVTIPDSVIKIGSFAFASSGITKLSLGKQLKEIGCQAFRNHCLKTVVIPDSISYIGTDAFTSLDSQQLKTTICFCGKYRRYDINEDYETREHTLSYQFKKGIRESFTNFLHIDVTDKKSKTTTFSLTWVSVENADGYEITIEDSYPDKFSKTVKGTTVSTKWTISADFSDYRFSIRPFQLKNHKKFYGKKTTYDYDEVWDEDD